MQLEAGKKYTDRRGRIYGPMVQVDDDLFGESAEDYGWYSNGIRSHGKISQGDLVAEYVEPVKADSKPADNRVNPGDGYRLLNVGEVEQADDEWYSRNDDEWRKTVCAGMKVTDFDVSRGYSIRRKAEPAPVESPDDWVEITDPKHVLRDTDQMTLAGNISGEYVGQCRGSGGWVSCQTLIRTGETLGCNKWARARCLRKDLPKVESPDDWVIQDRVPAREGIDFGWNVSAKDFDVYVPDDGWKWSIRDPYTGRMHGSYGDTGRLAVFGDTGRLAVFCRRKDLPPVPPVVDPGEGYRLLADDEITLPTDEREYTEGFNDEWRILPEANRRMVGRAVAAIREEWSGIVIRRKLPPATRTIVLKEWICWDDDYPDSVAIAWRSSSPSDGLDSSNFIAFDHAHPTGNTRTVEIPVT